MARARIALGALAALLLEEVELADGDLVAVDVEGAEVDLVRGAFVGVGVVAALDERPAGDEDHRRPVAVADDLQGPARLVDVGPRTGLEALRERLEGAGSAAAEARGGRGAATSAISGGLAGRARLACPPLLLATAVLEASTTVSGGLGRLGLRRGRGVAGLGDDGGPVEEERQGGVLLGPFERLLRLDGGLGLGVLGPDRLQERDGQLGVLVPGDLAWPVRTGSGPPPRRCG